MEKSFHLLRRFFVLILITITVTGVIIWRVAMSSYPEFSKKIVVIGIDALDYGLMKSFMSKGELPNFKKLEEQGSFSPLKTVCPPESVVVWTSFATGMRPGNHGIFDFIMRDPQKYLPFLSLADIPSVPQTLKLGSFRIPLSKASLTNRRKSPAFWRITTERKVPTYIYFCPNTFPVERVYGKMLAGMGVPDIRGTMGTFSFYTTSALKKHKYRGGLVFHVEKENGVVSTFLYGPKDNSKTPPRDIKIPFLIKTGIKPDSLVVEIQDKRIFLEKGCWSKWIRVEFKISTLGVCEGICRFYLKGVEPDIELYCSPVNFDPGFALLPITYPPDFSGKLAEKVGLFYTQGMPYDTWALNEDRIDEGTFLEQAEYVLSEREKILKKELASFKGGVFFFYFQYPDPLQHMFLHFQNREDSPYRKTILQCYKKMDNILGWVMDNMAEDTTLMVLSDHGFGPFRRAVHLNTWLKENGFLYLKNSKNEGGEFFEDVDWSRTKAYALGFGGIYINQRGRESAGVVSPVREKERIKEEIAAKLSEW
ncbi:MAG: hypothetical protein GF375_06480, partial [Candidatus Omnitrophica bacterium]|nr:hypothetical protein [Candidatus Omnitrophota bacterium]MBD3269620.1 hypothetical protein [Candidatus Omnitrophota bacterium]